MTDTYNDTTGSRKKFLIPLVVLLLCAVSLTGAGYAYNSSVTINGGSGTADEYFALDLYTTGDAVITDADDVHLASAIDGLVVTPTKVTESSGTTITGVYALEKDYNAVLFKGKMKVTADQLARVSPSATTTYTIDVPTASLTGTIALKDGTTYALANAITLTSSNLAVKFYDDEAAVTSGTEHDGVYTIGTFYYFQVILTTLPSAATTAGEITGNNDVDTAATWADGAADDTRVTFNFQIVATAVEADPAP